MRKTLLAVSTAAMTTLLIGSIIGPATAAEIDSPATPNVYEILAANPGGTIIDEHTISWENGTVVLTLEGGRNARAVGSCATGAFCAYNSPGLTGSKLTFTSCDTTQSTAPLGAVRSIANARSGGSVHGQSSSNANLVTVPANSSSSPAPTGVVKLRCVS